VALYSGAVFPAMPRPRGNPNWGRWDPVTWRPPVPTEFEVRAKQLRLTPDMYVSSHELRRWCERNKNRCYIPEWLLKKWDIVVEVHYGYDAA
jgi:hypothetical protein